jgi:Protein kinase domain
MVLIDFGIAATFADSQESKKRCPGTEKFMAKELDHSPFNEKCEMFSVGAVLVGLITGDSTLSHLNHRTCAAADILERIDTDAGPWSPGVVEKLANLACGCLSENPADRPGFPDLLISLKRLRAHAGETETQNSADIAALITAFQLSTKGTLTTVGNRSDPAHCVRCGVVQSEGVFCPEGHLICSRNTCLEEMIHENVGKVVFKCFAPKCSHTFELGDCYNKVPMDVFYNMVVAHNVAITKQQPAEDMKKELCYLMRGVVDEFAIQLAYTCRVAVSSVHEETATVLRNTQEIQRTQKDALSLLDKIQSSLKDSKQSHENGIALTNSGRLRCPRLCYLRPVKSTRGTSSPFRLCNEYQLFFLCAHSGKRVRSPVTIKEPKEWVKRAAPVVQFALFSLRLMLAASGLPVPGINFDMVLLEMQTLLEPEQLDDVNQWLRRIKDPNEFPNAIANQQSQIPEAAFAALAEEALKPYNLGWMDEMDIAEKEGGLFAWVLKKNVKAWKGSDADKKRVPDLQTIEI